MINEKSIKTVDGATFSSKFRRPLYDSYCFSQIPHSVEALFTGDFSQGLPLDVYGPTPRTYDHVIVLFLDAFGWRFFEKYKSHVPFLSKIEKEGVVSKITSMFPSTTSAHVTCINTGLIPSQTGIYEWFIYEPSLEDLIAPLPFCYAGERKVETLPLDPKELFPQDTLYTRLAKEGVKSYAYQPEGITRSTYSRAILKGAEMVGYHHPKEALNKLLANLNHRTYSYFYFSDIDSVGHRHGIDSKEFKEAIHGIFEEMNQFFENLPQNTALILTADHGMVDVDPRTTYYLNKKIPNIEKHLLFGERNKPLAPAGSCRDLFLHVKDEDVRELKEVLGEFLEGKAEIYPTDELIEGGFFGSHSPSERFLDRVGNLVILPYAGESVWWYEKNRFIQNFYGAHGGLTKEEMEIPFFFYTT